MAEDNVRDQIQRLVALQKIDSQIYEHKKELKAKPVCLADLTEKFEGKKAGLKALEEKFKAMQVERKTLEGELKVQEESIAKANMQLSQIKTNREYTAKITEIEGFKAEKSMAEENILNAYDKADEVKAEIEKEKAVLVREEQEFLKQKKEIEESIRAIEAKIKALEGERAQIVPQVDKAILGRYEKILVNKEGLAIVPVTGSSCGGCFMNVPAQVIHEIKMNNRMILCEMCARILYLEDNLSE